MEIINVENLSFGYPGHSSKTLEAISFTVNEGEFILVCGKSGCGKTTLLRLLKPAIAPVGDRNGTIYFNGKDIYSYSTGEQASAIGFVMQSPDNQIVTDKVWHELAFGLESLGYKTPDIRTRVSEMASFFGIQNWFHKNVTELSGGQKQLLNLAAIMVMQPSVLILDEPTSQLDPIAAGEFIKTLEKINRELGTTVIITEHRLEDVFPIADKVIVMDEGKITLVDNPAETGRFLKETNHPMYKALPTPVKVHGGVESSLPCPLTVRDGRIWLEEYAKTNTLNHEVIPADATDSESTDTVIELSDVWFRYERSSPDVVKGLNMTVKKGELFCLVGGNGTGKTTSLSLISGLYSPHRGEIFIKGQKLSSVKNLYNGLLSVLPQNPQSVFVKNTVYLDLEEMLEEKNISAEEKSEKIRGIASLCRVEHLLNSHPYDLSGGEQQRAATAKVLLAQPEILLLDEPTKGMDAQFKEEFADILSQLKAMGVTIVMVSHDIEFCAEHADRCALVFDGSITSVNTPREFFKGKSFYTTSANRMARNLLPDAVLPEDIISACGGILPPKEKADPSAHHLISSSETVPEKERTRRKPFSLKTLLGIIFSLLFAATSYFEITETPLFGLEKTDLFGFSFFQILSVVLAAIALFCFSSGKHREIPTSVQKQGNKPKKSAIFAVLLVVILIPLTLFAGAFFFGSRKYYFTSLLIILEAMIPFFMLFESRKPKARELIVISVLCGLAVAGRAAFFALPQFKPVVALVIIAGVCFGGETGFLVGSITGFVSNFFFGQGPWTPWQMFVFGIIGFISGILFSKGYLRKTRVTLCIFGFFATLIFYGGIMNPASVIMWQNKITPEMIAVAYASGLPLDVVHSLGTAFFLWFISEPMIEKLERIKTKYGLISIC